MSRPLDLTGQKIGRWTLLERVSIGQTFYRCRCDCGTERLVRNDSLRAKERRSSRSCGCLHREIVSRKRSEGKA